MCREWWSGPEIAINSINESILGNTLMQLKAYRHHNFGLSNTLWRGRWRRWVLQTFQLFIQLIGTKTLHAAQSDQFEPKMIEKAFITENSCHSKLLVERTSRIKYDLNWVYRLRFSMWLSLKTWSFLLTKSFLALDLWIAVSPATWHSSNDQYWVQSRPGTTKLLSYLDPKSKISLLFTYE